MGPRAARPSNDSELAGVALGPLGWWGWNIRTKQSRRPPVTRFEDAVNDEGQADDHQEAADAKAEPPATDQRPNRKPRLTSMTPVVHHLLKNGSPTAYFRGEARL